MPLEDCFPPGRQTCITGCCRKSSPGIDVSDPACAFFLNQSRLREEPARVASRFALAIGIKASISPPQLVWREFRNNCTYLAWTNV